MRKHLLSCLLCACGTSGTTPPDASIDAAPDASAAKANGTLGAWQTLAPMPTARANFCAAVVGSYVVAIGGNLPGDGGFTKLDAVHVARFHADGSLDPWQLAGHTPSPVTECTATGDATTLYLLDGIYDDASIEGQLFTATLAADGTLGTFAQVQGALPTGVDLFDDLAFTTGTSLVAMTSKLTGSCAVLGTPLGQAQWTNSDWLFEFRGRPQWATATAGGATFGYVLGGYSDADSGNVVLATGHGTKIQADGTTGPAFDVTALPQPTTFGTAASADDWVFVIGGRDALFAASPRPDVISTQTTSDGKLGAWGAEPPLPSPRSNVSAVVAGSFLYVLGGADASATDTVFAAQARF